MDVVKEYAKFFEKRGDSLARLLGRAQLNILQEFQNEILKKEGVELSLSQIHCLQFICLRGMNQRDLSGRLGVSKQAANKAINGLEGMGLIYKEPSPEDSRIKIIRHTREGEKVVSSIIKISTKIEDNIAKLVGEKKFRILKDTLCEVEKLY